MKTTITIINPAIVIFVFGCLALSPIARAVVPAPDGGYPGANTAEGDSALLSLTTGAYNTAVGFASLRALTTGNLNTAMGADTLLVNTGDQNTATGAGALLSNTTGSSNTANGALALLGNTEGNFNTALGAGALSHNAGNDNTAVGFDALTDNYGGFGNDTAVGSRALQSIFGGGDNTAIGYDALSKSTADSNATAVGSRALSNLRSIGLGGGSTAVGASALGSDTSGQGNTALGADAGSNVTTANNVICIGVAGNNVDNSCYIGNIFNATSSGGTAVYVNTNGRLGTSTSSRRFKEDIRPMDHASETLLSLKPVTFHYKKGVDPEASERKSEFGLVAEDVEKVNPDLVVRDKEGKPYSVRYDQVNAMLLNEFLKEHKAFLQEQRKVEEQDATIAQLKKDFQMISAQERQEVQLLTEQLKEQAAQIEKLSDQMEIKRARPGLARNDPRTAESTTNSQ